MTEPADMPITFRATYELRRALSAAAQHERLSISEFVRRSLVAFLQQRPQPYPRTGKAVRTELGRVRFLQSPAVPNGDPVAPTAEQARDGLPAFLRRPVTYGAPIPTAPAIEPAEDN